MKINAQNWHCRLFIWTWKFYHNDDKNPTPVPENTNSCQYFSYTTPFTIFALILYSFIYLCGLIKAFVATIIFNTYRPKNMTIDKLMGNIDSICPDDAYIPTTRWRGWGLWLPITVGLIVWYYTTHLDFIGIHLKYTGYGILGITGVIIVAFIVYGIWKGFSAWYCTDTHRLFKTWLETRKKKVCIPITIEGLPSESDT